MCMCLHSPSHLATNTLCCGRQANELKELKNLFIKSALTTIQLNNFATFSNYFILHTAWIVEMLNMLTVAKKN